MVKNTYKNKIYAQVIVKISHVVSTKRNDRVQCTHT